MVCATRRLFFFSSRRRHTRCSRDWSSDVCSSDLPPYGHVADARERAFLAQTFPALRGGEIDRYAAFLLRALQLVVPGGAAGLLVPDTWMFLSLARALREAIPAQAAGAGIVDPGKPFASGK